jgi:hypothetical protein
MVEFPEAGAFVADLGPSDAPPYRGRLQRQKCVKMSRTTFRNFKINPIEMQRLHRIVQFASHVSRVMRRRGQNEASALPSSCRDKRVAGTCMFFPLSCDYHLVRIRLGTIRGVPRQRCTMALRPIEAIDQSLRDHLRELAILEERIARVKEQIDVDKRDKNAQALVNRCPPEILRRIFFFCRPYAWSELPLKKFMDLTRVCSLWRTLALGYPLLWNLVPCGSATDWLLERAGGSTPLELRGLGDAVEERDRQQEIDLFSHSARIQALSIDFGSDNGLALEYLQDVVKAFLQSPAPLLETLDFGGQCLTMDLPQLLFAGHTPSLRKLHLVEITSPFQLGATFLRQLRSVTLHWLQKDISLSMLLLSLRDMPSLEDLFLRSVSGSESLEALNEKIFPVILPRLVSLFVSNDPWKFVRQLLLALETPVLESLRINLTFDVDDENTDTCDVRTVPLVSSYLEAHKASFQSCLVVEKGPGLSISAFHTTPVAADFAYCPDEQIMDSAVFGIGNLPKTLGPLPTTPGADAIADTMLGITQTFRNLSSLFVNIRDHTGVQQVLRYTEIWPAFLQALPASLVVIHVMVFEHRSPESQLTAILLSVLGSLDEVLPAQVVSCSNGVPLPGLRVLALEGFDHAVPTNRKVPLPLLSACLTARASRGSILERLELRLYGEENDQDFGSLKQQGLVREVVFQEYGRRYWAE